jgi:hypothetical protein
MFMNPKRQQAAPEAKDGTRGSKRPATPARSLEDLQSLSKRALVELAGALGLKGVSKLLKAELARRVYGVQSAPAAAAPAGAGPRRVEPEPDSQPVKEKAPQAKAKAEPAHAPAAPVKAAPPTAPAKPTPIQAQARPAPTRVEPKPAPARAEAKPAPVRPEAPRTVAIPPAPLLVRPPELARTEAVPVPVPAPEDKAAPGVEARPGPVGPATAEPPSGGAVPTERPSPAAAARLDLGQASPAPREEHIPWSYGQDRVTALAVDPGNLYAYWELTDPTIERARAALGAAGDGAWLNLRVFDVSGIIFDGGNAHSYFDHGLGRSDRQWFFSINRPSSSVIVEIGLRAADGGFARIARSSRVDFPRSDPAPWGEPEWMTVLASGEPVHAGRGTPSRPGADGRAHGHGGGVDGGERQEHVPVWILLDPTEGERRFRELFGEQFERIEWQSGGGEGWYEFQGRLEWQVGPMVSSWEEGPFHYPVQVEPPTRATWEGGAVAYTQGGVTRVVYGPWAVVIKNLHGHASHHVLGRWQIYRSWATRGGVEELQRMSMRMAAAPGGASERVAASGMLWGAGSELRLGGASEVWRIGASEVRLRGASEVFYAGASERRLKGASERRLGGASEWRLAGASERRLQGASERMRLGASEWRLGGASERQLIGASERRLQGASERRLGASEQRLGGASEQRPGQAADFDDDWDWEPPGSEPAPGRE